MTRRLPYEVTTRLVARALGLSPETLEAGLRPVTPAQLEAVQAFRRAHLGTLRWDDGAYLAWRYGLRETQAGFGPLMALWRDGELLGLVGAEDLTLRHQTHTLAAQRLMDLLIAPHLADMGLGAWLNQALCRRRPATLVIGANRHSAGLVERLFTPLPALRPAVRPVRLRPMMLRLGRALPLAPLAAPLADGLLAAWGSLGHGLARRGLRWVPIDRFDGQAAPWRSAQPARVQTERTNAYLQQRMLANPRVRMSAMALHDRTGRARGYVAWRLASNDALRELRLMDWQFDDALGLRGWQAALGLATVQARHLGCDNVRVLTQAQTPADIALLRRMGFVQSPQSTPITVGLHMASADDCARWAAAPWALSELTDDTDEG